MHVSCVSDDAAIDAVRKLAYPFPSDPRILAGESGACGVAASIMGYSCTPDAQPLRESLKLNHQSRVLAIITEGIQQSEGARLRNLRTADFRLLQIKSIFNMRPHEQGDINARESF